MTSLLNNFLNFGEVKKVWLREFPSLDLQRVYEGYDVFNDESGARFQASLFTCGAGEIGHLTSAPNTANAEKRIAGQLVHALRSRKGMVTYYMPEERVFSGYGMLADVLTRFGFKETKRFFNPNSGNIVVEWTVYLNHMRNYY